MLVYLVYSQRTFDCLESVTADVTCTGFWYG